MDKPKSNYKGMGNGPIGKRLAQAKMPAPRILHAGGGRVVNKTPHTYHPPRGGHGGMSIHGMLARKHADEREAEAGIVRSTRADQGMMKAMDEWKFHLERAKQLGIDVNDLEDEGGM